MENKYNDMSKKIEEFEQFIKTAKISDREKVSALDRMITIAEYTATILKSNSNKADVVKELEEKIKSLKIIRYKTVSKMFEPTKSNNEENIM